MLDIIKLLAKRKSVTIFVTVICFSTAGRADVDPVVCKHQIIFLPQLHKNVLAPYVDVETDIEKVAQSQFSIARLILQQKNVPVFSEQVDEEVNNSSMGNDLKLAARKVRRIFSSGIPESYEKLTSEQKGYLTAAGADGVLFLLGEISTLHKVVDSRETQDEIFSRIKGLLKKLNGLPGDYVSRIELGILLNDVREKAALREIKKYFDAHPNEYRVFLIYGRNHDFRWHKEIFPGECIIMSYQQQLRTTFSNTDFTDGFSVK